jgi:hypothetical protein
MLTWLKLGLLAPRHVLLAAASILLLAASPFLTFDSAAGQEKSKAEVVAQVGHLGAVYSAAFSPDGRLALSGMFNIWTCGGDLAFAKEAWGHLTAAGLTEDYSIVAATETYTKSHGV